MKKILLGALIMFWIVANAQNGLECIVVEKYYISEANDTTVNSTGGVLPVGSVTYRIYADMLPGYTFQAAYGVDAAPTGAPGTVTSGDHELRLQTSTLFFNNEDRGATSPVFTKARCADNTVMLDSWLSAGAACAGNYGILKTADNGVANIVNGDGVLQNNDASAGIPLTQQDGLIAGSPQTITEVGITNDILVFDNQNDGTNGPLFSTWNGSWACLGGCTGPDTVDNKVLIAQITTDGIFTFELNIQIGTPTGGIERYVARNPIGNEIMLPCLIDTFGVPNMLPTVSITSPTQGASFNTNQSIAIDATAADGDGNVTQVEFFVDGNSVGTDNSSPYSVNWTVTTGSHTLTAIAADNSGGQTTSTAVTINGLTVGVEEIISSIPVVKVFPSPAKDLFEIQITPIRQNMTGHYSIQDVAGNLLFQKNTGAIQGNYTEKVDIAQFASGIYFVKVSTEGFTSTQRIIKN